MPKSVEHSLRELTAMQLEFKRRVDDIESSSPLLPLNEQFQLYALREIKGREITGDNYTTANVKIQKVEFINQFGFFDLCIWVTNREKKILLISPEIYSRGLSGNEAGNGQVTLLALHHFLQAFSTHSGYTIICLTSLNFGSERLNAAAGYPIPQLMRHHIPKFKELVPRDQFINWLELLETLTHEASYYYQYTPRQEEITLESHPQLPIVVDFLGLNQADNDQQGNSIGGLGKGLKNLRTTIEDRFGQKDHSTTN